MSCIKAAGVSTHHCTSGVGYPCTVKKSFTAMPSQTVWDLSRTKISGARLMQSSWICLCNAIFSSTCQMKICIWSVSNMYAVGAKGLIPKPCTFSWALGSQLLDPNYYMCCTCSRDHPPLSSFPPLLPTDVRGGSSAPPTVAVRS